MDVEAQDEGVLAKIVVSYLPTRKQTNLTQLCSQ